MADVLEMTGQWLLHCLQIHTHWSGL